MTEEAYISTASKHPHPTNDDVAVIDWTFTSEWFNKDENNYARQHQRRETRCGIQEFIDNSQAEKVEQSILI